MLYTRELGRRLRAEIERKGLRPVDIARMMGESPQAVNGWLQTGRIHKLKFLRLCDILERPPRFFLTEESTQS